MSITMNHAPKRRLRFRLLLFFLLFAVALTVWFALSLREQRKQREGERTYLAEPALPVVWAETLSRRMDVLRAYKNPTDADIAYDSLIILPEDRKLPLSVESGAVTVTGIRYEIRSTDLKDLIERTEITDWETQDKNVKVVLPIQNLVQPGTEYRLDLTVKTAEAGELHYYARILLDAAGRAGDFVALAEDFSNRNFDYDSAKENAVFLESGDGGDNTSLGHVDLKSSFNQLTYGGLKLTITGEADFRLLEYNGNTAIVSRSFLASRDSEDQSQMQFEIEENFVMRKGPERIYLMDYTRTMHEIFLGDQSGFSGNKMYLGISEDGSVQAESSKGKRWKAVVSSGDLWLLDGARSLYTRIFSFRSGVDSGIRAGYRKHRLKILSLSDKGDIDFVLAGYMNRGEHEGEVGISLMHYDSAKSAVTEQAFIPSTESFEELWADMETLSAESGGSMFYFKLGNAVYGLDLQSKEYIVLCADAAQSNLQVSASQEELAWQDTANRFGASTLVQMQVANRSRTNINAGTGQLLRPLGYLGHDLTVGLAEEGNTWDLNGITRELPLSALEITDNYAKTPDPTRYEENGVLLSDINVTGSRVHLEKLSKTGDHSFRVIGSDTIVSNSLEEVAPRVLTENSAEKEKVYYTATPRGFQDRRARAAASDAVSFDSAPRMQVDKQSNDGARYEAYGQGKYLGRFQTAGEAINAAYESRGYVRADGSMLYCRAGTASARNIKNPEQSKDALLSARQNGTALDLYGTDLRAALYFVANGMPLLAYSDGGAPLILYGYDRATVSLYRIDDGTYFKLTMEEAERMFENGRCDFTALPAAR